MQKSGNFDIKEICQYADDKHTAREASNSSVTLLIKYERRLKVKKKLPTAAL